MSDTQTIASGAKFESQVRALIQGGITGKLGKNAVIRIHTGEPTHFDMTTIQTGNRRLRAGTQ